MLKRAKISVTRRKSKTIIFFLFLFIVANLVLSSISIKNATEESMKMARVSLGSEVILQTDMEKIRDEFMNNKDNEQSTDENKKDDMKNMHNAMDESAATTNDVNKLKEISYVTDVKYYFNVNATEKSFSLYESSKEDNNNNDRPGFDKKMNSGLQVKAINTFKLEDNYVNGTIKLTSGEAFDETKDDTVIISYELATENNLKVGDKITITSSDDKDVELEIIGIYQNSETDKFNNNYNLIYVNTNTGAKLLTEEEYNDGNYKVSKAVFYLDDPENADKFKEEANKLVTDFSDRNLTLDIDNESYEQMISSIEGVAKFSNTVLVIVVIASIVVISLMVINTLKDRNYEIGVLLSLGEKRKKIIGQFIIELVIIATFAFITSIGSSLLVSQKLADTLLENQTTVTEKMNTSVSGNRGNGAVMNRNMNKREDMSIGKMTGLGTSKTIDSIDVSVTIKDIALLFVIGYGIILVSMIVPSIKILHSDPKDILSRRE